jgi:type I restriction enzyme, S subunit
VSWRTLSVGDLVDAGAADIQTGPFGTQLKASDYVDEGTPVINVRNIGFGGLKPEKLEFVTEETAERLASHLLEPRDIVFGRKGAVDRHLYVNEQHEHWMQGSDCIRLRFLSTDVVSRFVSYSFLAESHQKWMLAQAGNKATMASLNHDVIRRIALRLPPPAVQEATVDILSAYDDLIENNRRRMALLEDAARQLYREWFVRLRFPGHEHTRVSDGLPRGWERRPLGGCATFLSGGTPSKSRAEFWEGEIPWVSSGEMAETRLYDTPLHVTEDAVQAGSRLVPANKILMVVRGMSLAKEFRLAMTARPMAFNQDLKALTCEPGVDEEFLFYALLMQRDHIRELATEASHGTKKLDTPVLAGLPILVPPTRLQQGFGAAVQPLTAQRDNLHRQNEGLRAARDLLLPRLMSGDLAV